MEFIAVVSPTADVGEELHDLLHEMLDQRNISFKRVTYRDTNILRLRGSGLETSGDDVCNELVEMGIASTITRDCIPSPKLQVASGAYAALAGEADENDYSDDEGLAEWYQTMSTRFPAVLAPAPIEAFAPAARQHSSMIGSAGAPASHPTSSISNYPLAHTSVQAAVPEPVLTPMYDAHHGDALDADLQWALAQSRIQMESEQGSKHHGKTGKTVKGKGTARSQGVGEGASAASDSLQTIMGMEDDAYEPIDVSSIADMLTEHDGKLFHWLNRRHDQRSVLAGR